MGAGSKNFCIACLGEAKKNPGTSPWKVKLVAMALKLIAKQKREQQATHCQFDKTPRTLISTTANYTVPITEVNAHPWTQTGEITLSDRGPQVAVADDASLGWESPAIALP